MKFGSGQSAPFSARYAGKCPECGTWFEEGTMVKFTGRDGGPVHAEPEECDADYRLVTIRTPPCSECGLIHAGECF